MRMAWSGQTQREMAYHAGVSVSTWRRWERDASTMPLDAFVRVCLGWPCGPSHLLFGTDIDQSWDVFRVTEWVPDAPVESVDN